MPKQKRRKAAKQETQQYKNHFELRTISPLTANQQATFDMYSTGKNMMLHGYAGTGKTFLSLYLSLQDVLTPGSKFNKVVIFRSAVPGRDMGFLPGNSKEKAAIYEAPYVSICNDLFGRGDGYQILKQGKVLNFETTSYLRGLTYEDTIAIVDECQNLSFQELDTVITRMGNNSRIIFAGDFRQTDLAKESDKMGLVKFINIIKKMSKFSFIEFEKDDIVRSGMVKEYLITKYNMENRT